MTSQSVSNAINTKLVYFQTLGRIKMDARVSKRQSVCDEMGAEYTQGSTARFIMVLDVLRVAPERHRI